MDGESCRRAKEEGVLGRRLPPSEVTRETDRVSSRRALGVAFGRPLPPPSGQPSWSSRGVTKGSQIMEGGQGGARQEWPPHRPPVQASSVARSG